MGRFLYYLSLVCLAAVLVIFGYSVVLIVQIQVRVSRNTEVGKELVESLHKEFPGTSFGSAASYQTETIYVWAIRGVDDANKKDVERWLRAKKNERKLRQEIWFQFEKDADRSQADREIYKF